MTKKIKEYLDNTDHKEIIDIIYNRAMLPKNRPEKTSNLQFVSLMHIIGTQIIKCMSEYSDIYDEEYVNNFLVEMKEHFMED